MQFKTKQLWQQNKIRPGLTNSKIKKTEGYLAQRGAGHNHTPLCSNVAVPSDRCLAPDSAAPLVPARARLS